MQIAVDRGKVLLKVGLGRFAKREMAAFANLVGCHLAMHSAKLSLLLLATALLNIVFDD